MTRGATLAGYAVVVAGAAALEVMARRTARLPRFGQAVALLLRRRSLRLLLAAGWLWLGWHLFVRVGVR